MGANREYKDSVFSMYMTRDPKRLIEVYNALQNTNYPLNTPVEINTLSDVLYKNRINDISFLLDGKLISMWEHQSTINYNITVRFVMYYARELEKEISSENIYRRSRIPIPAPECIVLYNGTDPAPDEQILHLSSSFIEQPSIPVEFSVRIVNINKGHNPEMMAKSKSLSDYSTFIDYVRQNQHAGMKLDEAIRQAVLTCQREDIMQPFLTKHASEVENMLLTEWNWEDAMSAERKEGKAEGMAEGIAKGKTEGMINGILSSIKKLAKNTGMSIEQAMSVLEVPDAERQKYMELLENS